MKQLSLFALALAFSANSAASILCVDKAGNFSITLDTVVLQQNSIQQTEVQVKTRILSNNNELKFEAYSHANQKGQVFVFAGDPIDGLNMTINSLDSGGKFDSTLELSIKGTDFNTQLACLKMKNN